MLLELLHVQATAIKVFLTGEVPRKGSDNASVRPLDWQTHLAQKRLHTPSGISSRPSCNVFAFLDDKNLLGHWDIRVFARAVQIVAFGASVETVVCSSTSEGRL